ncbi:MAG: SprT-like domain-containing protein [Acidobacteria bacterium]|nr:SprT-like domain-containing protein [Acidobacteriota bacterium]
MQLDAAQNLAPALMQQNGLTNWKFTFSKSKRTFGACSEARKLIKLSAPLTLLNPESEVLDTILHEIAHGLAGHNAGHNEKWKRIARSIGCNGERCYDSTVVEPLPNFQAVCPSCYNVIKAMRLPKRSTSCKDCSGGWFKPKFVFKFHPTADRLYLQVKVITSSEEFPVTLRIKDLPNGRIKIDETWIECHYREIGTQPCVQVSRTSLPMTFTTRYPQARHRDAILRFCPASIKAWENLQAAIGHSNYAKLQHTL